MTYPHSLWTWIVSDPLRPGRRYRTRHQMTVEDAMKLDPKAEKVPHSERVITGPAIAHGTPSTIYGADRDPDTGAPLKNGALKP